MRFAFCVVALTLCATIQTRPEGDYGTEGKGRYFENNLDGLQGALEDISKAGEDLATLETKLEGLVDGSGLIYKAESVLENSVGKDVYINAWKSGGTCTDTDNGVTNNIGESCVYYYSHPEHCEMGDWQKNGKWIFVGATMCCACGGGRIG